MYALDALQTESRKSTRNPLWRYAVLSLAALVLLCLGLVAVTMMWSLALAWERRRHRR